LPKNNGQKRRAAKAATKVKGNAGEYGPGPLGSLPTRKEKRAFLGAFVLCEKCGDRMLRKNMPEHVRKAQLHVEGK
jgi:hypothetical protein